MFRSFTFRSLVVLLAFSAIALVPGVALSQQQTPAAPEAPADVAAPPADAVKSPTGLVSKVLTPGTGTTHPTPLDRVVVHYTGWSADGKVFDSTLLRGKPSSFQLNRVLPGWTEGVQLMVTGEKRRFWLPEKLAFNGAAGRPAGTLCFDIELVEIVEGPKAPPDVSAPPADAQVTKSGLASKVLQPGTGTERPKKSSTVTVHYSGWTTDGKMFDSSVVGGKPISFPLDGVIAGWTEGVQLMVTGEKRRFWIPEKLAYKGQEGTPKGMLVFDVELIAIDK